MAQTIHKHTHTDRPKGAQVKKMFAMLTVENRSNDRRNHTVSHKHTRIANTTLEHTATNEHARQHKLYVVYRQQTHIHTLTHTHSALRSHSCSQSHAYAAKLVATQRRKRHGWFFFSHTGVAGAIATTRTRRDAISATERLICGMWRRMWKGGVCRYEKGHSHARSHGKALSV